MTWDEMLTKLRRAGVPEMNLPVRGHAEACLGLWSENQRFVVNVTERAEVYDVAEFSTEEAAVNYIFDCVVFDFSLFGDSRFQRWNASKDPSLMPRAEDFGGRTIRQ